MNYEKELNEITGDTFVWQIIKGQERIHHKLSSLKLEKIAEINNNKRELYEKINEEDRLYQNHKETLDEKTIQAFYELAKTCYKNAGIKEKYDESLEVKKEDWKDYPEELLNKLKLEYKTAKYKDIQSIEVSNLGRVRINGKNNVKIQNDKNQEGILQVTCYHGLKEVYNLVAQTWLEPHPTENPPIENVRAEDKCSWSVHHISNNGYDNRPENLIWLKWCDHAKVHPFMIHCHNKYIPNICLKCPVYEQMKKSK